MDRRNLLGLLSAGAATALAASCATQPQSERTNGVGLGIDALSKAGFAPIKGRRVGFVTNQTSVNSAGTMSRLVLQQGLGRDLVALFGPEHGLDTRAKAGDHVANAVDNVTGLRAFSLYGVNRKPTPDMLADVDVLVFDIQDIGVRSYTYISTMALAMEACGEAGKDFVVLDRPNPLGGVNVQGPPMEEAYRSFVGQIPVPYCHGMTIGELAKMIVAKNWINANPRLTIVPMQGWTRSMNWADTKLAWVPTSPNIPNWDSPFYCAATGILGELRDVDIGIGTTKPFHYAAARGIDGREMAADLNNERQAGVNFLPYTSTVKPGFGGVELVLETNGTADLMAIGMLLIQAIVRRTNGAPLVASSNGSIDLFKKVYGSNALWDAMKSNTPWRELSESWTPSLSAFKKERAEFLLYS